jgi:hypothetical protein
LYHIDLLPDLKIPNILNYLKMTNKTSELRALLMLNTTGGLTEQVALKLQYFSLTFRRSQATIQNKGLS